MALEIVVAGIVSNVVPFGCLNFSLPCADQRFPDEHEQPAPGTGAGSQTEIDLLAKKRCLRDNLRTFFTDNPTWK